MEIKELRLGHFAVRSVLCCLTVALGTSGVAHGEDSGVAAARAVISRFVGKVPAKVSLELTAEAGDERYATTVADGRLTVRANSPVALCHGFYAATKAAGRGMCGWAGNRFEPGDWTAAARVSASTPFAYRYYFNVVTYGYTMPYWTWERWSQEIDYMALHGINAPLALVGQEAIMARVFRQLGLTEEEIQSYFVGPAHLPWMRMGNISGLDSPMPVAWHADQIALQHKILARLRALGMKPIAPGFAGFVPPGLKRLYPDLELIETKWCGGRFHNWMILPNHPLFEKIGALFVREWEREFGPNDHYLVDSFNEMETPFPPKGSDERRNLLATYGEKVYKSLADAHPNAIWVMQGWMFGFQRNVWDFDTLAALMSRVPDDGMLLLDEAVDYNRHWWHNGNNWDLHKGYSNKRWVYGVIPNMGGKCGLTGVLDFYANGHLAALASPNRGRLVGHGAAPEGIENNQVIYELLSDAAWRTTPADTTTLLRDYSLARYGACPKEIEDFWALMRKSAYGTFTDHPRYNWQLRPGGGRKGSINANADFFAAIERFAEAARKLKSPLYRADLIEFAAAYAGARIEELVVASERAWGDGEEELSLECEAKIEKLMKATDRLLVSHPHFSLTRWIADARSHAGADAELADYYERNARRIVTIWGPPVDDYAAKIWSGLLRDYYLGRRQVYVANRRGKGKKVDLAAWERDWVEKKRGLEDVAPYEDPVRAAVRLIAAAKSLADVPVETTEAPRIGSWSPENVSLEWREIVIPVETADVRAGRAVRLRYLRGSERLEIGRIALEMDGRTVASSETFGWAGSSNANNVLRYEVKDATIGNNGCAVRLKVRTQHKNDSYGVIELLPKR